MNIYLRQKIELLSLLQVKLLMVITWCAHRLAIIAVPFDGLRNKEVTATELQRKIMYRRIKIL